MTVLEGAHKIDGMSNLRKIIKQGYKKDEVVLIVSILKDKKIDEMLKICEDMSDKIILTSLSENPRGLEGASIYEHSDKSNIYEVCEDMKKSYEIAKSFDRKVIVVCGSFYTCEKFKKEV